MLASQALTSQVTFLILDLSSFWFVHVYAYMWYACMCMLCVSVLMSVSTHVHTEIRCWCPMPFLITFLFILARWGVSPRAWSSMLVSIASWLALGNTCLWLLSAKIASDCHDLPAFMWVLGAQTPVLMPGQQLLCSLSHLPITETLRHRSMHYLVPKDGVQLGFC